MKYEKLKKSLRRKVERVKEEIENETDCFQIHGEDGALLNWNKVVIEDIHAYRNRNKGHVVFFLPDIRWKDEDALKWEKGDAEIDIRYHYHPNGGWIQKDYEFRLSLK